MQTLDDLRQFHEFVGRQLETPEMPMTPEQCVAAWRSRHPSDSALANSRADVAAAIDEMEQGDKGVPAREYVRNLRAAHGLAKAP